MRMSWVHHKLAGPEHFGRVALRAGLGTCHAGGDQVSRPGPVCQGLPRSVSGEMKLFGPQLGPGFPPKPLPNCLLYRYERFKAERGFSSMSALALREQQESGGREQALILPVPCALLWGCWSLTPTFVWCGGLGFSLGSSRGKGWSCKLLKGCLAIAKPTRYPEKREDGDTAGWYQRAEHERWYGAGTGLPWCYGASQHCGPLSSSALAPRAPCTPQGSQIPASSALLPRWQP